MIDKRCSKCGKTRPVSYFWIDRQRGRPKSHCRICTVAASRAWRKARPNYEKDRYARCRPETRERHLIRKYGISQAGYDALLQQQNGRCAICLTTPDTQANSVFHVDHCHETGAVRGLLCRGCNHLLGAIKDDPEALRRAITSLAQIPEIIGRAIMRAAA